VSPVPAFALALVAAALGVALGKSLAMLGIAAVESSEHATRAAKRFNTILRRRECVARLSASYRKWPLQPVRMKIVVLSDTHLPRFRARLDAALRRIEAESPSLILHCGDFTTLEAVRPFEAIAPFEAVAGNNDGEDIVARFGRKKIVTVDSFHIAMIHGDGTRGTTLGRARAAFENEAVEVIVFGHSHIPYVARHGTTWLVNPGSITDKRRQPYYSYAVIEIENGVLSSPQVVTFDA